MRQNISLNSGYKGKKKSKSKTLNYLIIPFILLFFILWIVEKDKFTSALIFIIPHKNPVTYKTYSVSFDESVAEEYVKSIKTSLDKLEFQGKKRFVFDKKKPDIVLSREKSEDSKEIIGQDLIPVVHIYSLLNKVEKDDLSAYSVFVLSNMHKKYLEKEYKLDITLLESYDELLSKLGESDNNIGLIGFDELDFRVKILRLDDKYYLDDSSGSIAITFYAKTKKNVNSYILSVLSKNIDLGNEQWEKDALVKVNMAGVVAMARGLASAMERTKDYAYPAREIGDFLGNADLTHVSNEVSFVPGCQPSLGVQFCSKPEYIEVLELSGVDIVELTGNHNNDYGSQYSASTIEMYKEKGMRYFGGGLNSQDASKILYEKIKDSTIAFVGYNYYDTIYPSLALAGENRSGANSYSDKKVKEDVEKARANGADIVIVTFQFQECYSYPSSDIIYPICYKPLGNPNQTEVFREAVDYGADIVIGSQAHQPQTYELYGKGIIFYGTGNLFFDQDIWIGTRHAMVLSHYFYKGKHIQTDITPIYMDKDLITRVATKEQGELLMELLKDARD